MVENHFTATGNFPTTPEIVIETTNETTEKMCKLPLIV